MRAFDPVRGRIAWEVETTDANFLRGFVISNGGVMTTAGGLIFQGRTDGRLFILDARTGRTLRTLNIGNNMLAAPMTYQIDGHQFVAIMAGQDRDKSKGRIIAFRLSGGDIPPPTPTSRKARVLALIRVLAFRLGGGGGPPPTPTSAPVPAGDNDLTPFAGRPDQSARGADLYSSNCAACHSGGKAPNLTGASAATHGVFMDIVMKGVRADKGMGSFEGILTADQARDIQVYLVDLAGKGGTAKAAERR